MDKFKVDEARAASDRDALMLKILGWLLALIVIGIIACAILAVVHIAISAVLTVGAICLIVALILMFGYHSLRWKIRSGEYERQLRQRDRQIQNRKS